MNINKPNDNKNMGQIDYGIFYTLCILLSIGVIMVYSASSFYAMFHNNDSMYFFKRQLIWAIIGIISMSIMMSIDYHKLKKITPQLLICTIPLLIAVFFFPAINGAKRWISLGPLSFQPSELTKYAVVMFLAFSIDLKGDEIKDFWHGLVPYEYCNYYNDSYIYYVICSRRKNKTPIWNNITIAIYISNIFYI